jgi:hypothetical protein
MNKPLEEMTDEEFDKQLEERWAEADAFQRRLQETLEKVDAIIAEYEPLEKLAAFAHERWANWARYMMRELRAGSSTIRRLAFERWERQASTPFADLPESEKKSDHFEAELWLRMVDESGWAPSTRRLRKYLEEKWEIPPDLKNEHPVDQAIAILERFVRREGPKG